MNVPDDGPKSNDPLILEKALRYGSWERYTNIGGEDQVTLSYQGKKLLSLHARLLHDGPFVGIFRAFMERGPDTSSLPWMLVRVAELEAMLEEAISVISKAGLRLEDLHGQVPEVGQGVVGDGEAEVGGEVQDQDPADYALSDDG